MMRKKMIAIALLAAALLVTSWAALAEGTLTVQGIGVVNVDADQVSITMGVREIAPDVQTAQGAVNERIAAVIDALKALGVGEGAISTSGIGIYPNYSCDETESITGYNAYNTLYVTLSDVNNVGIYIDAAFDAGANSLDYVEFSAQDTQEAADRAMALAVESANHKAEVIANAAGIQLGGIIGIQEGGDAGYDGNALYARAEEADSGAGTQVLASKQKVTATMSVTYAIAD